MLRLLSIIGWQYITIRISKGVCVISFFGSQVDNALPSIRTQFGHWLMLDVRFSAMLVGSVAVVDREVI